MGCWLPTICIFIDRNIARHLENYILRFDVEKLEETMNDSV